jgi:hypothetical protein
MYNRECDRLYTVCQSSDDIVVEGKKHLLDAHEDGDPRDDPPTLATHKSKEIQAILSEIQATTIHTVIATRLEATGIPTDGITT